MKRTLKNKPSCALKPAVGSLDMANNSLSSNSRLCVDSVLDSSPRLSSRQLLYLVCLALIRLHLAAVFISYLFVGRQTDFECIQEAEVLLHNECPDGKVEGCSKILFKEETIVSQFRLVCGRYEDEETPVLCRLN